MTARHSATPTMPFAIFVLAACGESPAPSRPAVSGVDGTVFDPSNDANALAIGTNTMSSLDAFEDHDRNGVEDHGR